MDKWPLVDVATAVAVWLGISCFAIAALCLPLAIERNIARHEKRLLHVSATLFGVGVICAVTLYIILLHSRWNSW